MSVILKRRAFDSRSARLAGVYGVRYVIGSEVRPVSAPELTLLRHGARDLFRNEAAVPRAYLVGEGRPAPNAWAAFAMVKHPSFDPRQAVVLEEAGSPATAEAPLAAATAAIVVDTPDRVVVETKADRAAWLVLNDTYGPGWEAWMDDQPAPIRRANGLVRAVAVPPEITAWSSPIVRPRWPGGPRSPSCALAVAVWLVVGCRPSGTRERPSQRPSISA